MTSRWLAASASQIGSVHIRDGTPTQDAHRTWTRGADAVIAVADGHGHSDHFRSAVGAELAATLALDTLCTALPDLQKTDLAAAQLHEVVAPSLVRRWTAGVLQHADENPFSESEQRHLAGSTELDVIRPYGSTVIAMVGVGDVLGILQLGDGDAVVAYVDGEIERPLPEDPHLNGVRTTSLCQPDPLVSVRTRALDLGKRPVQLAFIATDGFGSPRVDQSGWWMQTAVELVDLSGQHGFEFVADKLPDWLDEPATYGGDDTTVALMYDAGPG
jgi:serine/threonine protein phosphatase PrpC